MNNQQVHVVVRKIEDNIMDIFWGEGWTTWSRVRLITEPKNDFLHMDGIRLPWNVRIALSRYLRINLK